MSIWFGYRCFWRYSITVRNPRIVTEPIPACTGQKTGFTVDLPWSLPKSRNSNTIFSFQFTWPACFCAEEVETRENKHIKCMWNCSKGLLKCECFLLSGWKGGNSSYPVLDIYKITHTMIIVPPWIWATLEGFLFLKCQNKLSWIELHSRILCK